jgi:hypothetical protein
VRQVLAPVRHEPLRLRGPEEREQEPGSVREPAQPRPHAQGAGLAAPAAVVCGGSTQMTHPESRYPCLFFLV